jgi:3-hydroxyisobutyrate dehydrogenase-like beta-hydroxyacid dehydrogenase
MSVVRGAVLGLGRMGGPMADNAIRAGHLVRVYDISADAVRPRVELGGVSCDSPADAADGADVVAVVVFDDAQAREVVAGPHGVLRSLAPGSVVAIHTTVTLDTVRDLAAEAADRQVAVIDAGVSGGEAGASAGTLLTMVGGPSAAVATARPFLESYSKEVLHAGPLGAGMALKLARNATGYAMMAVVHEAMVLAQRSEVDLASLRHVILETGVLAQAMAPFDIGGPSPLRADESGARVAMEHLLRLAEKDLDHALELAGHLAVDLEVVEATRRTFWQVARLAAPGATG